MTEQMTMAQRWHNYRAPKSTLFWSCVGCIILTMVVGFTWGGWVTGGSARTMAEKASDTARADLAATICVTKFMNGKDAATQLATLKQTSNWKREQFIQDGGWATLPGLKQPVRDGADTCAQRLADMELPQGEQASGATGSTTTNGTTTVQ
jgi:hypothetical protein